VAGCKKRKYTTATAANPRIKINANKKKVRPLRIFTSRSYLRRLLIVLGAEKVIAIA
jgi:hypothetical protein